MKIIIYAMGQKFNQYRDELDWDQIVALADKKVKTVYEINGKPVIPPETMCKMNYDFIVIFSTGLYEEVKRELVGEHFVPEDKILPWTELVIDKSRRFMRTVPWYVSFCKEKRCKTILDFGMTVLPKYWLTKRGAGFDNNIILDGLCDKETDNNVNLYNHLYKTYEECTASYDAALLWEMTERGVSEKLEILKHHARYILFQTKYLVKGHLMKELIEETAQKYGNVTCISSVDGLFWIIDTEYMELKKDLLIYVVAHRKYNFQCDGLYRPLCVGGFQKKGCLNERKGENISYLNAKINECTALYWIWKNTDTEYIGMNHYRRYFYNSEIESADNYLSMDKASEILDEYDIILPIATSLGSLTVFDEIYKSINHELCKQAYSIVRNKLSSNQPDYVDAFDSVFAGHSVFLYNLFITKRDILNRYCEWLFSFLIEAAEETDVKNYDTYSQRVIGFFAERMLTVWLRKNRVKIKELPCVLCVR